MKALLALDQGTTSSRAIVFDRNAAILGLAQQELTQHFPQPGWVEHDPAEIWLSQLHVARAALREASLTAGDIAAIGIANQRETTLLWERSTGRPLHRAIVWQDRRTADACATLRAEGREPRVQELTGLMLDPYFSATKLRWLLDNVRDARERAAAGELAFGTVDAWLLWNLTGGSRHCTDVTNASRTMLFDIRAMSWSGELLDLFGIPRAVLPDVLPCTAAFGTAAAEHFGAPIAITGVAGDQQAALAGQAGFTAGIAKNTYGTGAFAMLNAGAAVPRSAHGLLTTIGASYDMHSATYALEGAVFNTGTAVQWLRDGLHLIERAPDVERLARECEDSGGVFFVPAFTGLGAPQWDPAARGTIVGITRGTSAAHIARATLEAIAFQCAGTVHAMEQDAGVPLRELRVDGGGSVNALLMQMQADLIGVPVVRPAVTETTAFGAAIFAGLQCGFWKDPREVERMWREEARFEPRIAARERRERMRQWQRAVERSLHWVE